MAEAYDNKRRKVQTCILERAAQADGRPAPATTNGERQVRVILRAPVTESDELDSVENDEESLVWRPCMAPSDELLFSKIGLEPPDAYCFACNVGMAAELPIHGTKIELLRKVMEETRGWNHELQWAQNVQAVYEEQLRKPSMLHSDTKMHLPEWKLCTIIAHARTHIKSPEMILSENIRKLDVMANHMYNNGVFVKNMMDPTLHRVNMKYMKMTVDLMKAQVDLMKCVPSKMFGHSVTVTTHRETPYGNHSTITSRKVVDSQQKGYVPFL